MIFVAVLLVGTAIGTLVTHFVRLSIFSGIDRLLGGLFGLLRGVVMIGAACHPVSRPAAAGGALVARLTADTLRPSARRMCCAAWSVSVKSTTSIPPRPGNQRA